MTDYSLSPSLSLSRARERAGVRALRQTPALIPRLLPQAGEGANTRTSR